MIMVVTNREDPTADWLVLELQRRGTPYLRLNTEDYPSEIGLRWREDGRAELTVNGSRHDLTAFSAVWYRRPLPAIVQADDPAVASWASREAQEALESLWRTHDALWVNRPDLNLVAGSKPNQLRKARALGFDVPDTLITNDVTSAREFVARRCRVVCKPLTDGLLNDDAIQQRIFWTSEVDAEDLAGSFGPEPYLLQEHVPKRYDVRVTVIGTESFAVRIDSQREQDARTDWRRGDIDRLAHKVETLPEDVAARCLALVHGYGLKFGAIDLARRPDGGYSFFELNPNGQWAWLEQRTGLPLRARLADLLGQAS